MARKPKGCIEVGLVLQGGGALGAYECGATIALLELMDAVAVPGRTVVLTAVTGVSIGAVNAACVVGSTSRSDARARLNALWDRFSLKTPPFWTEAANRDFALFGVPGFYTPRSDFWKIRSWTHLYDTSPLLKTLADHVDFAALNGSDTGFVVTAVDAVTGELKRFRNRDRGSQKGVEIKPSHILASGSLPSGFPSTPVDELECWDGGLVDNTPLGEAISSFSGTGEADRFLVVMNLFRLHRAPPQNMVELNDRLQELRFGNRVRQDRETAQTINDLVETIRKLAAVVPKGALNAELKGRIEDASRFKVLDEITDIDLADPELAAQAGVSVYSEDSNGFRDFSVATITRRREIGYRLAKLKLTKVFAEHGLLAAAA